GGNVPEHGVHALLHPRHISVAAHDDPVVERLDFLASRIGERTWATAKSLDFFLPLEKASAHPLGQMVDALQLLDFPFWKSLFNCGERSAVSITQVLGDLKVVLI